VTAGRPGPPAHSEATAEKIRELVTVGAGGGWLAFTTNDVEAAFEAVVAAGAAGNPRSRPPRLGPGEHDRRHDARRRRSATKVSNDPGAGTLTLPHDTLQLEEPTLHLSHYQPQNVDGGDALALITVDPGLASTTDR
jgi:hypothetical protein